MGRHRTWLPRGRAGTERRAPSAGLRRLTRASLAATLLAVAPSTTADAGTRPTLVTVRPAAGPPGTTVVVDGAGYAPRAPIAVLIGSSPIRRARLRADRSGRFRADLAVPVGIRGIARIVTRSKRAKVVNRFQILGGGNRPDSAEAASASGARVRWGPLTIQAGSALHLQGSGFSGARRAELQLAGWRSTLKITGGRLAASLPVPEAASGTHQATLKTRRVHFKLAFGVMARPLAPPLPGWPAPAESQAAAPPPTPSATPTPAPESPPDDTTPPAVTIQTAPAAVTNQTSASFGFSSEPAAALECRLDGAAWAPCQSPREYGQLEEGEHRFQLRATDAAGNTAGAEHPWRIDTVRPSGAAITSPASGTAYTRDEATDGSVTVVLQASATDDSAVYRMEFRLDGVRHATTSKAPFQYKWKVDSRNAGRHRWVVRAFDEANNASPMSSEVVLDVRLVSPSGETEPVPDAGDAADDAAVWIDKSDPSRSVIFGTDKKGGLAAYDLAGRQQRFFADSLPNNVDLRYGFALGDRKVDLVATTDRATNSVRVYSVEPAPVYLQHLSSIPAGEDVYGICMYRSAISGRQYVFTTYDDGSIREWELLDDGGTLGARAVDRGAGFGVPGRDPDGDQIAEGCVADDISRTLYVSEENTGIARFDAEPGGEFEGWVDKTTTATPPGTRLVEDVEGLAIYHGQDGTGYLLASSQGSDEFVVYDSGPDNAYVTTFGIGYDPTASNLDRVRDTDGIEVVSTPLGVAFPSGLFIAQDNFEAIAPGDPDHVQNFKLVRWEDIARVDTALRIDTGYTPW